ncbi:MAG: T-box-containing protein [Hydrococcus sp. Prado102]|jgi:hypothetical protein|nr:T-box-containing protein [Hydrococcus sp. Prado102]
MTNSSTIFSWDFSKGTQGWQGGFADYPLGQEDFFNLDSGLRLLPSNLGSEQALFITGDNRSDDLFMYFRNQVTGLNPNTNYSVIFDIELATNAPDGSFGIGGSPANSVFLKAGATLTEPLAIVDDPNENAIRLNIDKGNQSQSGRDSVLLGDIAKPDDGTFDYALIPRNNNAEPFTFRTDNVGNAWLYFGTDSGFEGTTALFYTSFQAEFTPQTGSISVPEPSTVTLILSLGLCTLFLQVRKLFSK